MRQLVGGTPRQKNMGKKSMNKLLDLNGEAVKRFTEGMTAYSRNPPPCEFAATETEKEIYRNGVITTALFAVNLFSSCNHPLDLALREAAGS